MTEAELARCARCGRQLPSPEALCTACDRPASIPAPGRLAGLVMGRRSPLDRAGRLFLFTAVSGTFIGFAAFAVSRWIWALLVPLLVWDLVNVLEIRCPHCGKRAFTRNPNSSVCWRCGGRLN